MPRPTRMRREPLRCVSRSALRLPRSAQARRPARVRHRARTPGSSRYQPPTGARAPRRQTPPTRTSTGSAGRNTRQGPRAARRRQRSGPSRKRDSSRGRRAWRPRGRLFRQPDGVTRAARAPDDVASSGMRRHGKHLAAVRAADARCAHGQMPSKRFRRPRSNPTMVSSPTTMTGTAVRPVLVISSARAAASSPTFLALNSMPWDERNSFVA
jgi:hypothetical protein